MECPNCEFQNVPGMRACARCASTLDFSQVAIDPPRATDHALPLPVRSVFTRFSINARHAANSTSRGLYDLLHPDVRLGPLLRCVIPGWGHRSIGQRRFGWFATGVWAVLLVLAIYLHGGDGGWFMYFVLVGWHGFVVSLMLTAALRNVQIYRRVMAGLLTYLFLNFGLYFPSGWLALQAIRPFEAAGVMSGPTVRNGDVFLCTSTWTKPVRFERGDIVVYSIKARTLTPGAYVLGGQGLDRVLAEGGDVVELMNGEIRVNGALLDSESGPLRPLHMPQLTMTVPAGCYFILPSMLNAATNFGGAAAPGVHQAILTQIGVVEDSAISGKVLCRWRPLWRATPSTKSADSNRREVQPNP